MLERHPINALQGLRQATFHLGITACPQHVFEPLVSDQPSTVVATFQHLRPQIAGERSFHQCQFHILYKYFYYKDKDSKVSERAIS